MARKNRAAGTNRRQATRVAVIAFLAADCAGIWYAQHRLSQPSPAAARFAYETPGMPDPANPAAPIFTPAAPGLAMAAPAPAAQSPAALLPPLAPAPAPVIAPTPAFASVPPQPLTAPRAAPKALAAAPLVAPIPGTLRPAAPHRAETPATPFDNAFTLDGEAPDAEQRFGQNLPEAGGLADLLVPREEPAPIFDKAGIAPVNGQAASIDAPAEPAVPGEAQAADLLPNKG